ncbi:MAG TPA: HAD family phosphatase [Bryobacteraceae bacterium]|nr:HAD family phosphatase [Bryobacteraceae bacterium]
MPEFDAILFDFDGVLCDSEPVHWACWAGVLAPMGVTLEWEFYRDQCIGIDDREMLRMMASRSDPPREWEHLWAQYPAKRDLFRSKMMEAPPFPAGIAPLLDGLRGEYKMAVVTSSGRPEIEPMLRNGGLLDYFDTLVCAGDVTRHKPAPDPYLLAAERLGARTALVLEDSDAGIASGRAAGFEVLPVKSPVEVPNLVTGRLSRAAV